MSFHECRRDAFLCYQSDYLKSAHGFTTRLGGVSSGQFSTMNLGIHRGDEPENVRENFRIAGRIIGFDPAKSVCAAQVHGDTVRTISAEDWGKGLNRKTDYEADGLMTNVPGTALLVFSADCGTVLLEDPMTGAVGACHAGWRGVALGIAGKTVQAMAETYGCDPGTIRAVLGPCISKCCFETNMDVPKAMLDALGEEAREGIARVGGKYHVDLKYLNRLLLEKAGVPETQIDVSPLCTACDPETFWSHRRHGEQRGSLAAVIVAGEQR